MITPSLATLLLFALILLVVLLLHVSRPGGRSTKNSSRRASKHRSSTQEGGGGGADSESGSGNCCCCCACCVLCWIFCCPPCLPCIVQKMSFHPPRPTYVIEGPGGGGGGERSVKSTPGSRKSKKSKCRGYLRLHPTAAWQFTKADLHRILAFRISASNGTKIACVYIPGETQTRPKYTILFSHGNAADIGQMSSLYFILSRLLNVNVLSYDYEGFGQSTGSPDESALYRDVEAAYRTLREKFGIPANRIILYGQSIGSAPTVDLASRAQGLAGVVLQSGLSSGCRVFCPSCSCCSCCDSFNNLSKAKEITSPVLVIHGTADEIIPIEHGLLMYQACRKTVEGCWIQNAGHNDLVTFNEYYTRMKKFLVEVEQVEKQLMEI